MEAQAKEKREKPEKEATIEIIRMHVATHAGGVVHYMEDRVMRYFLVREKKENVKDRPLKLVLPKGHIEPGEEARETAVREVREEADIWATISTRTNVMPESMLLPAGFAWIYFMEGQRNMNDPEAGRHPEWLTWKQVLRRKDEFYPDTLGLPENAERRFCDRAGLGNPPHR